MTKKMWLVAGVLGFLMLGGGLGFWYWRTVGDMSSEVTAPGSLELKNDSSESVKSVPLKDGESDDSGASANTLRVLPAQDTGQTGLGTSSDSNSPTVSSSDRSGSSFESPDNFEVYEKYLNEQHALYGDMVNGNGAEVTVGKKIAVNYKGWLTNGQLFDASKTGEPFVFVPGENRVITGWEEGVIGMKVGGKRRLIVPPAVGYGSEGKDPIPPNALMVFDIELVAVQP